MEQPTSIHINNNVLIEFTPQQLQVVVSHLNKGVFERVAPIIDSIQNQVLKQVQQPKETAAPDEETFPK